MRNRIYLEDYCYFLTINSYRKKTIFRSDRIKILYLQSLDYCRNKFHFKLLGFAILPNHIHLLIIPPEGRNVSDVMHHVNGVFASRYNRIQKQTGRVIQRRFWDHVIRNDEDFNEKLNYIHNNPIKHGLAGEFEDWQYSSWRNYYLDDDSLVKIDTIY